MTGAYWDASEGGARLVIDADALSRVLVARGAAPVNQIAATGAKIARDALRDPTGERFIGYKTDVQSPVQSRGFHLKSGRIPRLSQGLRIPVALVFNNSNSAVEYEVGTADGSVQPTRPLLTAYQRLRRNVGVTGIRMLIRNAPADSFRKQADNATRRRARGKP